MRPRSKDVAILAGVSAATVSHVMNGTRFVSPATRERVLAAVTQLGYSSNAVARSLRRGRTGLLALVVTDIENPFCTRLARCVADAAFERGYQVILGDTGERADRERWLLESFRQQHVDGVILAPSRDSHQHVDVLRQLDIPIVLVNRSLEGVDVPHVVSDSVLAGRMSAEYLIGQGHHRIGIVQGYVDVTSTTRQRLEGIRLALSNCGLTLKEDLVACGDFTVDGGRVALTELMRRDSTPTAVIVMEKYMAVGVLLGLKDLSLRCPEDVEVVSFGDPDAVLAPNPVLTIVRQPIEEMAKKAVALMLDRVEGLDSGASAMLEPTLIVRGSPVSRTHQLVSARLAPMGVVSD